MTGVQQIPMEQLETGRWYVGRGRNGSVGLWNGECFLVIGQEGVKVSAVPSKWENRWVIKQEPNFTESSGCFQPFVAINEGVVAESLDRADSLYGYARNLCFVSLREI
jgi:hypothetical protein